MLVVDSSRQNLQGYQGMCCIRKDEETPTTRDETRASMCGEVRLTQAPKVNADADRRYRCRADELLI
jgi:hypothetical protein